LPSERDIVAVIPILESPGLIASCDPVASLLQELRDCSYINETFVVSSDPAVVEVASRIGVSTLERPEALDPPDAGLGDVLKWATSHLAGEKRIPDYIVYANPEYVLRPSWLIETLIEDVCFKGLDTAFVAYPEYQNYWRYSDDSDDYEEISDGLLPRQARHPMLKALPGLGTVTRTRIAREGRLVSDRKVGVVKTTDLRHTLRTSAEVQRDLIHLILVDTDRRESH